MNEILNGKVWNSSLMITQARSKQYWFGAGGIKAVDFWLQNVVACKAVGGVRGVVSPHNGGSEQSPKMFAILKDYARANSHFN